MRVHRYVLPALALITLLGSVGVGQLTGVWATTGKGAIQLDASGAADPQGIKGWMTLQQISDTYGIPLAELYRRIGAPSDMAPETPVKDLEAKLPGFETALVREQVAAYRQEHPESISMSSSPVPSPAAGASPSAAPAATARFSGATPTALPSGQPPVSEIKGSMSLADVAERYRVPVAYLAEKLKLQPNEDPKQLLKDLASKYGFEVEAVRTLVAEYQATHP